MKVLVGHNFYRSASPSGENAVVRDEVALLRDVGVHVVEFFRDSDEIADSNFPAKAAAGLGPIHEPRSARAFADALRQHRPDIVHLHNVFPLLGPGVVHTASQAGIPVVQTLHNYRHECVNGLHFRDGQNCTDCIGRTVPWPAVAHGCYRGSRVQTVPMAVGQVLHRRTWRQVAHFIALTEFMAAQVLRLGVPAGRITVRPTAARDPGATPSIAKTVLFAGRFDAAKGADLLLEGWRQSELPRSGWRVRLLGAGHPDLRTDPRWADDPTVVFEGSVEPGATAEYFRTAGLVAIPSRVFEGYPRVFSEACAQGRGLMVSDIGSLGTIGTEDYVHRVPPTVSGWRDGLNQLLHRDLAVMGRRARQAYESTMSPEASMRTLLKVYAAATGSS